MYELPPQETSQEFLACWKAAGIHLQHQVEGSMSWLKANPYPPFLEHISFRLGNQLFFVRLEDTNEVVQMPGSLEGLLSIADGCQGIPCLMPMRKIGSEWRVAISGWGLVNARDGTPFNPIDLVSDKLIEVSDWELQDFAVQIVRDHLIGQGKEIISTQSNPGVNPSIWFHGEDGHEWVVVRAARHPAKKAPEPKNIRDIVEHCTKNGGKRGHFASVSFADGDDPFDPLAAENGNYIPVYRGHKAFIRFEGLIPIAAQSRPLSSDLCAEIFNWNDARLSEGADLPKVFTAICPDNRQFVLFMSDLPIDRSEHIDFMKAVLADERATAFCFSLHVMTKIGEGTDDLEERREFVAGETGHYEYVSARLIPKGSESQELEIVTHRKSEEPEWFMQEMLRTGDYPERYIEIWKSVREKVMWRSR